MSQSDLINSIVNQARGANHDRSWSASDEQFLLDNIRHMTIEQLAQHLGRTPQAVHIRLVRQKLPRASKYPGYYTGLGVANLLGLDSHSVALWHSRGVLRFDILPGVRGTRQISKLRLWSWLVNPDHWIYFDWHRCRDPHLRRLLELQASRWQDEWWTTEIVRVYYGLADTNPIQKAIDKGYLQAVRWGNWRVKRSWAMEHKFFPGRGSGRHTSESSWTPAAEAYLLRARAEGQDFPSIAARMKKRKETVRLHYYNLIERGIHG